ncbi:substrate-binding domain-containing protein [Micromonospora sp. NPDC002296]|uniref:substrate-binding domain-containing protein n=1 Tax=Micromonospora sp. NPDC002296 TaxID=3154271 RepID=UPI00332B5455
MAGFRQAMARHGYAWSPSEAGNFTRESGEAAMRRLLASHADLDGVFVANDLMAQGALVALHEAGRRVPDDVAVVGFDDSSAAQAAHPPLTTVRHPLEVMAAEATRLLLAPHRGAAAARRVGHPRPRHGGAPQRLSAPALSAGSDRPGRAGWVRPARAALPRCKGSLDLFGTDPNGAGGCPAPGRQQTLFLSFRNPLEVVMTRTMLRRPSMVAASLVAAGSLVSLSLAAPAAAQPSARAGQPVRVLAHTCNGSEDAVSSASGSRVCFYEDTWTYKICDTASGNHPAIKITRSTGTSYVHENPGVGNCGPERSVPVGLSFQFWAQTYSGDTLLYTGNRVIVL